MTMIERYGVPPTKIIELMRSWRFPFRNVRDGDRLVVFTDDGMDPMIWQSAMAAAYERGAEPVLCLYPRRLYHCADPPAIAISAAKSADAVVALTTTALNSGTPGLRQIRAEGGGTGSTPIWLMEEMTVDILAEGGGRADEEDIKQICELQERIGAIYDESNWIHVTSKSGTDLTADISQPPFSAAKRWGGVPFSRVASTDRLGGGTWPFGEVHVEPVPGTANGTVVWDTTAHYPPGRWKEPVALTIKDGQVVAIDGGHEAEQVRWYLETYGDENSWKVGGEIAIGTNKLCPPNTGIMRSEKKRYGAMHFGIGHGADRGQVNSVLRLEGIVDNVSIAVDDKTVISDNGKILV